MTSGNFYGLQFHPEVTHTSQGRRILERFVLEICGCDASWTTEAIIEDQIGRVRQLVGEDTVLLGLSGGVDSSVVAALLHEAIGDKLLCIFVGHRSAAITKKAIRSWRPLPSIWGVRVERVQCARPVHECTGRHQ